MLRCKKIFLPIIATTLALFYSSSNSFDTSNDLSLKTITLAAVTNNHDHEQDSFSALNPSDFETGTGTYSGGQITGGINEDNTTKLFLNDNITCDITIVSGYVALCLNGKTLTGAGSNSVITVSTGAYLTLCDCQENEGTITDGNAEYGGGIYVDGGSLTMSGGAITGNTASINGGGVFVFNNGSFTMSGGTIEDNTAGNAGGGVFIYSGSLTMSGGTIYQNKVTGEQTGGNGGGVYVYNDGSFSMSGGTLDNNSAKNAGGGVFINTGSFTMSGGTISNNNATANGGGVSLYGGGSFTMSGGTIEKNTTENAGGGIYVSSGTFNLSDDGAISDNTASSNGGGVYLNDEGSLTMSGGTLDNNSAGNVGGGVFVNTGSFEFSGGKITNNKATNYGGGVHVYDGGSFAMSGGTLYDNSATESGDAVYNSSSTVEIKGGYFEGTIVSTSTKFITGGCFGDVAYESITTSDFLADDYFFITYSDESYYDDNDYDSDFPYVVYKEVTISDDVSIYNLTVDCDKGETYSEDEINIQTPTGYQVYGDVEYSYEDKDNQTVVGLPTEAGDWSMQATVKLINTSSKEYTEQTATFTISIADHIEGTTQIENDVDPTCTDEGSYDEVIYCTACSTELSREEVTVSATGHTEGASQIENEVDPTCTANGSYDEVVYCTVCTNEVSRDTVAVDATGHSYSSGYTNDDDQHWRVCEYCNDSTTDVQNHVWSDWEVITEATKDQNGEQQRACTVCGATQTAEIEYSSQFDTLALVTIILGVVVVLLLIILLIRLMKKKKELGE